MNIPLDEVLHFDVVTSESSGAAVDADSTPTWAIFEEATDTPIQTGNFTKRTSLDGEYRGTNTLSAANGYEVGKWYHVKGYATVDTVPGKDVAFGPFRIVSAESVVGVPEVDVTHVAGESASLDEVVAGTATAGGAATITLGTGVTFGTNLLRGRTVTITAGTGIGQSEVVLSNTNATPSVVTIARNWLTAPDNTSEYSIGPTNYADFLDLADGIETGLTLRQAMRLVVAAAAGKLSGADTTTIVIRNAVADSKDRITATVTADGNRTAVTTDLT